MTTARAQDPVPIGFGRTGAATETDRVSGGTLAAGRTGAATEIAQVSGRTLAAARTGRATTSVAGVAGLLARGRTETATVAVLAVGRTAMAIARTVHGGTATGTAPVRGCPQCQQTSLLISWIRRREPS